MHLPTLPLDIDAAGGGPPPAPDGIGVDLPAPDAAPAVSSGAAEAMLLPAGQVPDPTRPRTALDTWHALLASHLAARPNAVGAVGTIYPACTVGDIRRAALRFSRELCLPRYDLANLTATRAAWRDALERIRVLVAALPWSAAYPDSERFWLGDSLALAQRLAAVDVRRNRLVGASADGLAQAAGVGDPLTTYSDLRAYFLARRLTRTDDTGWRYPETTVGDARQLVALVDVELRKVADAPPGSATADFLVGRLDGWHRAAAAVEAARGEPADRLYADNRALWRAYRKLAIALSVAYDLSARYRQPFATPVQR